MKSFKLLAASLTLIALCSTGCQKETFTGIDTSKPQVADLICVEAPHNGKTITMGWNAEKAVAAGATSFTLQLVEDKDGLHPDNYNTALSATVQVEDGVTSYIGKIAGQEKGNCYYVRVRANYKKSIYSDWTWLTYSNGKPALFKCGRGIITEGIEDPYMYKVTPTSTGIIVKWDAISYATGYVLEYKKTSDSEWTTISIDKEDVICKIKDLPSLTEYQVRMLTITEDGPSEYCETQTVTTRQPGSFKKEMATADELMSWLESGVVEVEAGETYSIVNDIDLNGENFSAMDEPLLGTFDGNGFTISGVTAPVFYQNEGTIKNVTIKGEIKIENDAPEFGALLTTNKGTVDNVKVDVNVTFETVADADMYIGGVACYNEGVMNNVENLGAIKVSQKLSTNFEKNVCIGGIISAASEPSSQLISCTNKGAISYTVDKKDPNVKVGILGSAVAGIAGFVQGSVKDCVNSGAITQKIPFSIASAGKGFLPYLAGKVFTEATYYGTPATAGIAGYSLSEDPSQPLLEGCVNNGPVNFTATSINEYTTTVQRVQAAGIIANPFGLIKDCTNNGALTFQANTTTGAASTGTYLMCCGGIGGGDWFPASQAATNYENCVNNGAIEYVKYDKVGSSNSTCGGIVGWPGAEGSRSNVTKNCTNNGDITFSGTGKARVGGIHGGSGAMNGCVNNGRVHCLSGDPASAIGGLSGFTSNGLTLQKSESRGPVTSDIAITGGLGGAVGNLGNSANSAKLTSCIVATKIENKSADNARTGMLVGYYNGTSASVPLGASGAIKVSGKVTIGGKSTALTAGNFESFLVGTDNASADNHKITAVFDTTPYVDPDGGHDEPEKTLDAPTNVAVTIAYDSVTITWDEVEGAEWYVVEYKKKADSEWIVGENTNKCSYTIEGLAHGTEYSFRVKAFASIGSGYSGEVNKETLPEVNLDKPVVTLSAEPTTITASWAAVSGAVKYAVEYKASAAAEWVAAGETAETSKVITGLQAETAYDVRVKALGEGGNEGEFCDPVSITTEKITITYPYTVTTSAQFAQWLPLAETCSATDEVILGADIDLSGVTLAQAASFAGILNGNGKSIKNWTSTSALIQKLTGTVKNLNIDASCKLTFGAGVFGTIAAESTGTIESCKNYAAINYKGESDAKAFTMGTIVGVSSGSVKDCHNEGAVTVQLVSVPSGIVGGVVGLATGPVSNCSNKAALTYSGENVSAKAAIAANTIVSSFTCVPQLGGIVGLARKGFSITDCNNSGNLSYTMTKVDKYTGTTGLNQSHIAGIVAASSGNITNCENTGNVNVKVTASDGAAYDKTEQLYRAAGISGGDYFATGDVAQNCSNITNCKNSGNITMYNDIFKSNAAMGGIVAWPGVESTAQTIITENCSNSGTIKGDGYGKIRIGGIQGGSGNMKGCTNTGEIIAGANINAGSAVGSICGFHTQGMKIEDCHAEGKVTVAASLTGGVGGLIGNMGNVAMTSGDGCTVNCVISHMADTAFSVTGLVVGYFNGTSKVISLGDNTPIKVKGEVNGVAVSADNFMTYLTGTHANNATNHTINAQYGE